MAVTSSDDEGVKFVITAHKDSNTLARYAMLQFEQFVT